MGCHFLLQGIFPIWGSNLSLLHCRQILNQVLGKPHQQFFEPYYNIGEGNGTPLQYSCLENPMDGGDWWAAIHGVTKSRTRLSNFTFTFHFHALEKETTTHLCSCLENSRDGGAWWAAVYGVTQSRTRLKRLSSSSSKQEKRPKGITHHSIFLVIFNIIP